MASAEPRVVKADKQKNSAATGKAPFFQPKLTVNQPNDVYEQEADAVADQIVKMPNGVTDNTGAFFKASPALIQRDDNTGKTLTEGASVVKDQLSDKPGFDDWQEKQTDALKKELWDKQPTELKAGIIGFGLSSAGILGSAIAFNPAFRADTLKLLDDKNIALPLSLIPHHDYFPLSSFKYKLPSAAKSPVTFDAEFEFKPYLELIQHNWSFLPKTDITLGVSAADQSGKFSITGGFIKLKLGGGIINLQGFINQTLPPTPMLVSGTEPGESPMWIMRTMPGQFDEQLPKGNGVFLTVDVMRIPDLFKGGEQKPTIQRKCAHCEEEEKAQRKESNDNETGGVPASVQQTLSSGGQPMDRGTQKFMEQRFGQDFGDVKIHTGSQADESSAAINARAFTHQNHVVFGAGQYNPETQDGKRLIAHELTHVLQQKDGVQTKKIQRKVDDKDKDGLTIDYYPSPKGNVKEDVKFLKDIITNTQKAIIIQDGILKIYKIDGHDPKLLQTFMLKKGIELVPIYHYYGADGTFYPIAYDSTVGTYTFKGIDEKASTEQNKALQALNQNYSTENWFSTDSEKKHFYDLVPVDEVVALIVMPYSKGGSQGAVGKGGEGTDEDIPPKPDWAPAFEKKMVEAIKIVHAAEPLSEDLPDVFKFYYSKNSSKWRGYSAQNDLENKPVNKVYLDIEKNSDPVAVLTDIRQQIRIAKLRSNLDVKPSKDGKPLPKELMWAYELKLKIETLMAKEREKHTNLFDLPDKISLTSDKENDLTVYLRLDVFVEVTDDRGGKSTQQKTATLPDPLQKGMQAEDVLKLIKRATSALRGTEIKMDVADPKTYENVKFPYPADISAENVRADNKTVTGAHHQFKMNVHIEQMESKVTLNLVTLKMRTMFYYWDLYRVDDQLTDDDKKKLPQNWKERRPKLLSYFKGSKELKTQPLINKDKLKAYNERMRQLGLPEQIDENTKFSREDIERYKLSDIFYGSRINIVPEADITFPDQEGEYLLYCRAQVKPEEDTFILPSEAFFPIKVEDGYRLAKESVDKPFDEIENAKKQLADAKTDDDKKAAQQKLDKLMARQSMSLSERLVSDINTFKHQLGVARQLKEVFKESKAKNKPVLRVILEKDNASELWDYWQKLYEDKDPLPLEDKLNDLIEELAQGEKGMEDVQSNLQSFKDDYDPNKPIYTPVVTLVSKETGQEYQLITMLGETKDSNAEKTEVILIDVTTHKTQAKYYGTSTNPDKTLAYQEAVQDAFIDMGKDCPYGKGSLQYRIPIVNLRGQVFNTPGPWKQFISILEAVAAVAGIAALLIGTVFTGGGLLVAVLGIAAATTGAFVAGYHIYHRLENHNLEPDIDLALDILNILGPLLVGIGALAKVAKVAALSAKTVEGLAAANSFLKLQKGIAVVQKFELATNFFAMNYKTVKDLRELDEANIPDSQKQALEKQILLNAALANVMIAVSVRNEALAEEMPSETAINEFISNAANQRKYRAMLEKDGLIDAEGNWTIPELQEAAARIKGGELEEGTEGKTGVNEPTQKPGHAEPGEEKHAPDDYEKRRDVEMKGHEKTPDGEHEMEVYEDGTCGRCSPAAPGAKCPLLQQQFKELLDKRPNLSKRLEDLMARIDKHGENVPKPLMDELAAFEQHLRGMDTVYKTSSVPSSYKVREVEYGEEVDLPLAGEKTVLEFPNGERVWRNPDGTVEHEAGVLESTGRAGMERQKYSWNKMGLIKLKYERAHTFPQSFGWESPYSILYAPSFVNQRLQNNGIEQYIRSLRDLMPAGYKLMVGTKTAAMADSLRLKSIEYDGAVITPDGTRIDLFNYKIEVSGTRDAPVTDAQPIGFDTNPDPARQNVINNIQSLVPSSSMPHWITSAQHYNGF
jgi:hypothetical protein